MYQLNGMQSSQYMNREIKEAREEGRVGVKGGIYSGILSNVTHLETRQ